MELWDLYDGERRKTGRLHERGTPVPEGFYHIVVNVWIKNGSGQYLCSKRTMNKPWGGMWECTGGSAVAGDDSLSAAVREVKEELGIVLEPEKGRLVHTDRYQECFRDVWLFKKDVLLDEIVFQENETCAAKWAAPNEILQMLRDGEFVNIISYLEKFFEAAAND